jgi:hypothetical protein
LSTDGPKSRPRPGRRASQAPSGVGRAQLTLVEHALCPLDTSVSLSEGLTHRGEFFYLDENRHQRMATAKVACPFGLSPSDELYLWGLMALTLSQREPSIEFYATPYYCLSELGVIDRRAGQGSRGGKNYVLFREAIARLAGVTYVNDHFYDPIRGEHRSVTFGFLSYSLPRDPASSRAWRFIWDPLFFEFCQAARGSLLFDLETYRSLDFASRRLFLLLKKIFYRNPQSPAFDVRHLGVNVLGFAPSIDVRNLKVKLGQCIRRLSERGIIGLPPGTGPAGLFEKKGVGVYSVRFQRGCYFEKKPAAAAQIRVTESPLYGPLKAIGFDDAAISRITTKYKAQLVQVWSDITLAAMEKSPGFFKVSPQAYFMDSIEKASRGTRTPPDWWYEHRKEEERRERESKRSVLNLPEGRGEKVDDDRTFEEYLRGEGQATFAEIMDRLRRHYESTGHPPREAARNAADSARMQMRNRFRKDHPERETSGPQSLGDVLKKFKIEGQGEGQG